MKHFPAALSLLATGTILTFAQGCVNAANYTDELHSTRERELTVGTVQREIRKGMSSADVAEQLGSPNIVQRDDQEREIWIYDKIASEASYSTGSGSLAGGVGGGATPGAGLILGGLFGSQSKRAGAYASTDKTLTVIVRFDKSSRVESFSYHSSKF